ncbi:MAG: hypothetical protein KDI29_12750 [Pseudomonadales bacterium]|nr:hypothetical protein [Pseudomonadales bacterium]
MQRVPAGDCVDSLLNEGKSNLYANKKITIKQRDGMDMSVFWQAGAADGRKIYGQDSVNR